MRLTMALLALVSCSDGETPRDPNARVECRDAWEAELNEPTFTGMCSPECAPFQFPKNRTCVVGGQVCDATGDMVRVDVDGSAGCCMRAPTGIGDTYDFLWTPCD